MKIAPPQLGIKNKVFELFCNLEIPANEGNLDNKELLCKFSKVDPDFNNITKIKGNPKPFIAQVYNIPNGIPVHPPLNIILCGTDFFENLENAFKAFHCYFKSVKEIAHGSIYLPFCGPERQNYCIWVSKGNRKPNALLISLNNNSLTSKNNHIICRNSVLIVPKYSTEIS